MNNAQIESQNAQIQAEAKSIDNALAEAVATKNYGELAELEKRVNQLAADRANLEAAQAFANRSADSAAKMGDHESVR